MKYKTKTGIFAIDLERLINEMADAGWKPILMTQERQFYTVIFESTI